MENSKGNVVAPEYPVPRNLDGVYFRTSRGEKWENICFSDLTEGEMDEMLKDRSEEWLKNMCKILGKTIRKMGDELDVMAVLE